MDRIPVNVTQPGKVGLRVGQVSFPILEPNLTPSGSVPAVGLDRAEGMQVPCEGGKRPSLRGRQRDEMVVIGEHRLGLQLPLILLRQLKQQVAKVLEALMAHEGRLLQVRGASHDVSSRQFQAVNRAVRPIAHKIP